VGCWFADVTRFALDTITSSGGVHTDLLAGVAAVVAVAAVASGTTTVAAAGTAWVGT